MKVITNPTVTIVGTTEFREHPEYKIPWNKSDALSLTSFAAKGCYDSFGEFGRSCEDNQLAILNHGHGSVLEHYHISLFIEGITRSLSLELNRHRTFNISQRSTRYTAEEDSAIVLDPYFSELFDKYKPVCKCNECGVGCWRLTNIENVNFNEANLLLDHLNSCVNSIEDYERQVEQLTELNPNNLTGFELRKWARGKARNLLPHALETKGVWTNNIRGWRWFVELRSERHAEPEIRRLADAVLLELRKVAPFHFEDFESGGVVDGIQEWVPLYQKV